MKVSLGLVVLGAVLAGLCYPPHEWTDYIGIWWGLSCIFGGGYGVHRALQRKRTVKAVRAMLPEQSLFIALQVGCPECGKHASFYHGPEGPGGVNIYCCNADCRQGYNISPGLSWAEKIGRTPPFKYPEDFRDVKLDGTPKPVPEPAQSVALTRKQITRTNVARRMAGRPRLSAKGFEAAVVSAPPPSGQGAPDWLLYFMMFNAVDSAHISDQDDIGAGLKIDHVTPGGGQFGGAGATSSWIDNTSEAVSAPIVATDTTPAPTQETSSPSPSYSESSASPSPDTSSPSESSSSSSSDSSSSSSYDSSSSSGGGDSGGGGGGGGD